MLRDFCIGKTLSKSLYLSHSGFHQTPPSNGWCLCFNAANDGTRGRRSSFLGGRSHRYVAGRCSVALLHEDALRQRKRRTRAIAPDVVQHLQRLGMIHKRSVKVVPHASYRFCQRPAVELIDGDLKFLNEFFQQQQIHF